MPTSFVGNKREIPNNLPPLVFRDKVWELEQNADLNNLDWYLPQMEYLSPEELRRLRAKGLIWREETGDFPTEINWFWEVRMARRRGDIPPTREIARSEIDEDGTLKCGYCEAKWSANYDGSPHPNRCKLCDRRMLVIIDKREVKNGSENI